MIVDDVLVVRRGELTDEAWAVIAPLLPESGGLLQPTQEWRDLATRYAKRASPYRASLVLIAAAVWLR
jgi:transposase